MTAGPELQKGQEREKYYKKIESTPGKEQRTIELVKELTGLDADKVVNYAFKKAFPDKTESEIEKLTLTHKVLLLQDRFLGFKLRDTTDACDGILGPITLDALKIKIRELEDFIKVSRENEEKKAKVTYNTKKRIQAMPKPSQETRTPSQPTKPSEDSTGAEKPGTLPIDLSEQPKRPKIIHFNEINYLKRFPNFTEAYRAIESIQDPEELIRLKDQIEFDANDKLVSLPDERGTRLRTNAALCYKLFKQYALLKGFKILVGSGYRSYNQQVSIWESTLKANNGDVRAAWSRAAPPGKSSHQTGGTVDIQIYDSNGKKWETFFYPGSKAAMKDALSKTKVPTGRPPKNAFEMRKFLDEVLMASHFLGLNYHRENWHWVIDNKKVYKPLNV